MTTETTTEINPAVFDDAMVEQLAQQSEAAFKNYQRMLSDVEKQMLGQFVGVPEKLKTWVFYRVGLRNSSIAQAMAHMMRQQGWLDAPRSVKMIGTEYFDGSDGALIIMIPQDGYRRAKDIEQRVIEKTSSRAKAKKFDGLQEALSSTPGVDLTEFSVDVVDSTQQDITSNVNDTRARRLNKRA